MEWKVLLTVFGKIFVAELDDKTHHTTLLFAVDKAVKRRPMVFSQTSAMAY